MAVYAVLTVAELRIRLVVKSTRQTVGAKVHRQKGNSPDVMLRFQSCH